MLVFRGVNTHSAPGFRHRCGLRHRTDGNSESDRSESQESGEFQKINSLKSPEESLEVPKFSVFFLACLDVKNTDQWLGNGL